MCKLHVMWPEDDGNDVHQSLHKKKSTANQQNVINRDAIITQNTKHFEQVFSEYGCFFFGVG